jgi:transcriptional regulator GlxA family with amidase domain
MLELKQHTKCSERSLQMIFKKHLNKSPFEYIEEQRLLKAHELIKQHKQSKKTTDIAREVGFRHLGRFSVNFKKRFGIHPSVLARSNIN